MFRRLFWFAAGIAAGVWATMKVNRADWQKLALERIKDAKALLKLKRWAAAYYLAGYAVELLFGATGLTPTTRSATVIEPHIAWNYTTWLNLAFLVPAAALVWRFFRTGGLPMLRMMGGAPDAGHEHAHH